MHRAVWAILLVLLVSSATFAADRVEVREERVAGRVFEVKVDLKVEGKVFPQPGAAQALPLTVKARFGYVERPLEGAGREAQQLRSVRHYTTASAAIEAGKQVSNATLRESVQLVVAQGTVAGMDLFSPSGPLTFGELELLRVPCDSLGLTALLPTSELETGETWKPADWVLPLLCGIEAAEKSELECKLESVTGGVARVAFQGSIQGATLGAATAVKLEGHFLYDLGKKHLVRFEATQSERRNVGAVSQGMDVKAQIVVQRSIVEEPSKLTDKDLAGLPLEANEASRLLMLDAPDWNVRFFHDRNWHLFHQSGETTILRLLDKGGLISQCNVKRLTDAEPEKHLDEEQFQADIQRQEF
jgi:hypothetical protein